MSSSLGRITVELDLNDKNFTIKTIKAGKTVKSLAKNFDQSNKSIKNMERSITGVLPKLRDIAITASILKGGIHNLYNATLGWQKSIIDTNANIERMTFLLKGMSNATTELGRNQEAAKNLGFLFDMAEKAPFSLNEVTNSFVKMKSVGLDNVEGAVKSLTDSVAQFGGTDDVLHRATVAIQQMAGKGVISMEELRQQLGEAVPTAIKLMARSMGLSYQELVNAISSGRVEANDALQRMLREMDRTMGGAGLLMMETWSGMLSRMQTRWTKFQVAIGDNQMFEEAKQSLSLVIDGLDPNKVEHFAQVWGEALATIIQSLTTAAQYIIEHGATILETAKNVGKFVVIWKGATIIIGIITRLKAAVATMTAAMAAQTVATTASATGLGNYTRAAATATASTGVLTASLRALKVAMLGVMGPLGWAATALGVAVSGWALYNEEADKSKDIMESGRKAIDENTQSILKNAIAANKAQEQANLANQVRLAQFRDDSADSHLGVDRNRVPEIQAQIDEEERVRLALVQSRLDMQKRLHDGETLAATNHAEHMTQLLQRELAKRNKDIRAAYSDRMAAAVEAHRLEQITGEQFNAERQQAMIEEYDGMIAVARQKQQELNVTFGMSSDHTEKESAAYKAQVQALQEEILRLTKLKIDQVKLAGEAVKLMDGQGGGANSRLENFVVNLKAGMADATAEINGANGELDKFMRQLEGGMFGEDGETLLSGGEVLGHNLEEYKKFVVEHAKLRDLQREAVTLRREEESAVKSISKKASKMAQEAASARNTFLTGSDGTFVDRINREIDELLANAPNATEEVIKLAEAAKKDAVRKTVFSNATDLKNETRKIKTGLLKEEDRYQAELEQKIEEARAKLVESEHLSAEEQLEVEATLQEHIRALREETARESESSTQKMLREWEDVSGRMKDATAGWLNDASDKLAQFVTTGKADFGDLVQSILADIIKIQLQGSISGALGGGSSDGGILNAIGGWLGSEGARPSSSFVGPMPSNGGGWMDAAMAFAGSFFADGGIMTNKGKMNAYADGGIANSPQMAVFGEADMAEAFVPLPDGKTIPVTMAGGQQAPNIQVNVINQTKEEATAHQGNMKFNGKQMILDVVMTAVSTPGPFRDGVRGAVR